MSYRYKAFKKLFLFLQDLGDHWRPMAALGNMLENDHFWGKLVIFKHVAKGRQGSPRAAKGFQGPRGTPGMGEMSFNQIDHI